MNKTLETLVLLNKIYDSYLRKRELSDLIEKIEFDFFEERNKLAENYNKDLALPDIASLFDDSLDPQEKSNKITEFMKQFDRFEDDFKTAKSSFDKEWSKRAEQMKEDTRKNKEQYFAEIVKINDFLRFVPLSQEHFDHIPELRCLINEGAADTIEEAVSVLSGTKNRFINH